MKLLFSLEAHRSGGPAICCKLDKTRPFVLQLRKALELKTNTECFWQGKHEILQKRIYQLQIPHKLVRFRTRIAVMTIRTFLIVAGDVTTSEERHCFS